MNAEQAQRVLSRAERLADRHTVTAAYERLAAAIAADYRARNPLLLAVVIGGLVPAAEIARRLDFPLELDYLHATRYRSGTVGGGLVWKRQPPAERLVGRHLLVIDDVLDEGHTLAAVRRALAEFAPASLAAAVLVEKAVARDAAAAHAEYVGLHLPNRYLFGCGMDYHEHWRHLPEIYAVGDTQEAR